MGGNTMWYRALIPLAKEKFLLYSLLTAAFLLLSGAMATTVVAKNKAPKEETKTQASSLKKTKARNIQKLKSKSPKQRGINRNLRIQRKAPSKKGIPGAPDRDNVLPRVPSIVSKPPIRGDINTKNLTNRRIPSSPSLTGQQPARNTNSKVIPGHRQSGPRKRAAEKLFRRGSQRGGSTTSNTQQQKFPGAKDLATNGNSGGQAAGHSRIGIGRKLSRKKPKVDDKRDGYITDGTSVSDKGCCGPGLVDHPSGFQHRRRAGRTVGKQHIHPQKKKKGWQIGAGEGETGGGSDGEGEAEGKKKKSASVSQPVPGASNAHLRGQAEKLRSQLGIKRSKNTPIDPNRNPDSFNPGPIDRRFIPKKSDLAQPVPGEESGGPRFKREKNFGSSTGVFGSGAIDPGAGGN